MGYTVEVSFNMDKCGGISQTKNQVFLHANSCYAESTYEDYEMSGNVKQQRKHCVIVSIFHEDDISNCSRFIKIIGHEKSLYLESVYNDENPCQLIYASPHFIKNMEKRTAQEYKRCRAERSLSLSEGDSILLEAVNSIKKKSSNKRSKSLNDKPSSPSSPYLFTGPTGPTGLT